MECEIQPIFAVFHRVGRLRAAVEPEVAGMIVQHRGEDPKGLVLILQAQIRDRALPLPDGAADRVIQRPLPLIEQAAAIEQRRLHRVDPRLLRRGRCCRGRALLQAAGQNKEREEIISEQKDLLALAAANLQEDVELIESFFSVWGNPLESLSENIKRMAKADYVIFSESYENARSCRIEYECAKEYGKNFFLEHGNNLQEVF